MGQQDNGPDRLGQIEIPAEHLNAVVGVNESAIADIRKKCGGIMIAMMPAEKPGAPLIAYVGPGPRKHVDLAEQIIRQRLDSTKPKNGAPKATNGSAVGAAAATLPASVPP